MGEYLGQVAGPLAQLLGMAQGAAGGALPGLLAQLENAGLAERVRSWMGHGENLPVTAEELSAAFPPEQLNAWAERAGTTPDAVLEMMSAHLPQTVSHVSRTGTLPTGIAGAVNRQVLLVSRPQGAASADNFRLVETPLPRLVEGEVRVRNHYMSLDPYMRGRMNDSKSYAAPQALDTVMQGGTVGVVEESRNPAFTAGDAVLGGFGWQEYGTSNGAGLHKVDTSRVPMSAYLGAVGMPGVTAWYGLNRICAPKPGETVVVSAASGAVGSVVGQLAKRQGCRAVGIAGGADKCAYVRDELGFDACVDYKAGRLADDLAAALPDGIDGYFDNVGGEVLDAVMRRMNAHGRIAICGAIAGYDGPPLTMAAPQLILVSRLKLQGFIVSEHMELWPQALTELGGLVAGGQLKFRESVALGLENAVEAFLGLLKGRNFGKQVVQLV